jgi:hypothetical protein
MAGDSVADFFEIDFLDVESKKSGDAICIRYEISGKKFIHVVDGGFQLTGDKLVQHINKFYDNPSLIDHVVATHNDSDHAGGLRTVLEQFEVGALWMLRPWLYADVLIDRFSRYTNPENLAKHLKEVYANLAALEDIAIKKGIPIFEPFQGAVIGAFRVMAPTSARYLDLIVSSEKTPDAVKDAPQQSLVAIFNEAMAKVVRFIKAAWGVEVFPDENTSAENEMSVVQYANLCNQKILLTGDTGREGLREVINYAPTVSLSLPGIDRFQVPHHGSRRNLTTELLDSLLGSRSATKPDTTSFSAIVSSAKEDEDHPRKAVIRALHHRGALVATTEGKTVRTSQNAPDRGWSSVAPAPYPDDQEE